MLVSQTPLKNLPVRDVEGRTSLVDDTATPISLYDKYDSTKIVHDQDESAGNRKIDEDTRNESINLHTLPRGPSTDEGVPEVGDVVDGEGFIEPGWKGWICVLGAFLMNSIGYGMINSFGVFQNYYALNQLSSSSTTQISWIGSIQLCLTPLLGCFSGPLFDAGYLRALLLSGSALYTFSLFMTSLSKEYYQVLLAHGIGVGLGMGIMFSPSVSCLSHHFGKSRWRSLVYGIQATGSCLGGIVFPILGRELLPRIGFGWTMRVFAFIVLGTTIIIFFSLSTVHPPRDKIAILSPSVFRNVGYVLHTAGSSCGIAAIYCPLTFGVTYGRIIGLPDNLANYSLAIINGCSFFGRILPLMAAHYTGFINIQATFAITSSIMLFCWTRARDISGLMVFNALYGVSSGAYAASYNPGAASFAPSPDQVGLYIGMSFFVNSFFSLTGTPITAALIKGTNYLPASMFCGAIVGLAAAFLIASRFVKAKQAGTPFV